MFPLVIKDFVSKEEAETIIEHLDPKTQETPREGIAVALGWRNSVEAMKAGISEPVCGDLPKDVSDLLDDVFNRTKSKFEEVFGHEAALTQANYQNMTKGGKNDLHSDTTNLDGTPLQPDGTPEEMEWSGLIYLNDAKTEYEGGAIVFPNQGVELFPETGDFVLFPGDIEHVHLVTTVTSGERKNLVFFYGRPENVGSEKSFYNWQDMPPEEQQRIRDSVKEQHGEQN